MSTQLPVGDISIVIIGNSGEGISATGNTILGREEFAEGFGSQPTTKYARAASFQHSTGKIIVMDTPGVTSDGRSKAAVLKEINRMAFLLDKRVNCFVIVMNASIPRGAVGGDQVLDLLASMKDSFQEDIMDYCLLVYTRWNAVTKKTTFLPVKRTNPRMASLLDDIKNRVVFIENDWKSDSREVLIREINRTVEKNRKGLTNDWFAQSAKYKQILTKKTDSKDLINAAIEAYIDCSWLRYLSMDQGRFKKIIQKILEKNDTKYDDKFDDDVRTIYENLYRSGFIGRTRPLVLPLALGAAVVIIVYHHNIIRLIMSKQEVK